MKLNKNAARATAILLIAGIVLVIGILSITDIYKYTKEQSAEIHYLRHFKDSSELAKNNHKYSIISKQNKKWTKVDCCFYKWRGQAITKKLVLYAADSSHILTFENNLPNILIISNK